MHWISKTEYRCYDCMKGRKVKDAHLPEKPIGPEPIIASASGDVYDERHFEDSLEPFFEPSTVKMQKEKWSRRRLKLSKQEKAVSLNDPLPASEPKKKKRNK